MVLDAVERVEAKRNSSDFQDACFTKERNVPGIVTVSFGSAIELINEKALAGAG